MGKFVLFIKILIVCGVVVFLMKETFSSSFNKPSLPNSGPTPMITCGIEDTTFCLFSRQYKMLFMQNDFSALLEAQKNVQNTIPQTYVFFTTPQDVSPVSRNTYITSMQHFIAYAAPLIFYGDTLNGELGASVFLNTQKHKEVLLFFKKIRGIWVYWDMLAGDQTQLDKNVFQLQS